MTHRGIGYRPEIDGMRAIAVLAVVLFHAGFGFSGGFVGVDVFFVISGYLITSLIWKDLASGSFSFADFWERRARRIAPAWIVVTVVTLIAGWWMLLPSDFEGLSRAAAAQAVFAANFHYWLDSGYFASASEQKPLLHTWSLAVEEQFYLVIPLILWCICKWAPKKKKALIVTTLGVGAFVSLVASQRALLESPTAAFYLLPFRAWELQLGALLAFVPQNAPFLSKRPVREFLSGLGLVMILFAAIRFTEDTPFPGVSAIPPCLGAALIILSANGSDGTRTAVAKLLSVRPLVFIGLISYSLYLWHWPILAFANYLPTGKLDAMTRLILLGAGFVCAVISWRFVETPFRTRRIGSSRKSVFAYAASGMAAIALVGGIGIWQNGFPDRFSDETLTLLAASEDKAFINKVTAKDIDDGRLVKLGEPGKSGSPSVLVWGDSHAMAAMPALDKLLAEKGLTGAACTYSVTAPVLDWFIEKRYGLSGKSLEYNQKVVEYAEGNGISDVMMVAMWEVYHHSDEFRSALIKTVQRLHASGIQTWLLLTVPKQPYDVPRVLAFSNHLNIKVNGRTTTPENLNSMEKVYPDVVENLVNEGCRVINPKHAFYDSENSVYVNEMDGTPIYRDRTHLSATGARLVLLPLLREHFTILPSDTPLATEDDS